MKMLQELETGKLFAVTMAKEQFLNARFVIYISNLGITEV
jgi:hypothetical protein